MRINDIPLSNYNINNSTYNPNSTNTNSVNPSSANSNAINPTTKNAELGTSLSGSTEKNPPVYDKDPLHRIPFADSEDGKVIYKGRSDIDNNNPLETKDNKKNPADPDSQKKAGRKSSPEDCETCKNRKYKDGSDENNVSFKSATHISPESAASAVMAHENEHVANAYNEAASDEGTDVVSCSVSIHTSICPECGRSYVSGGTTHTQMRYTNEENPYQKELKAGDAIALTGASTDLTT